MVEAVNENIESKKIVKQSSEETSTKVSSAGFDTLKLPEARNDCSDVGSNSIDSNGSNPFLKLQQIMAPGINTLSKLRSL